MIKMEDLKSVCKMDLLKFLDTINYTQIIEDKANQFKRDAIYMHQTFYCPVIINLIELNTFNENVCKLLIQEPHIIQEVVTDIVLSYLSLILNDANTLQTNQIVSPIVISPVIKFYCKYPTIQTLEGVIVEIDIPQKYIRTSTWTCNKEFCKSLNPTVSKLLPKQSPLCGQCYATLEEMPNSRFYGTRTHFQIINPESLKHKSNLGNMSQWVPVYVEDDRDCKIKLELGLELRVMGIQKTSECFEMWGGSDEYKCSNKFGALLSIERLRSRFGVSPWAFVTKLANVIGGQFYPPDNYMHLRMGLLLSLASTNTLKPIPIISISKNWHVAEQIMLDASMLSRRCVRPCLPTLLGGQIKNGRKRAGALLLASKGVCFLGVWDSYNGINAQTIKNAVETGVIVLDKDNSVPLQAAVWTCNAFSSKKKDQVDYLTLSKVFGLTWNVDDNPNNVDDIYDYILRGRSTYQPEISKDEFRHYLEIINDIKVTLSKEAMTLLKRYFVCARRARGGDLPLTSLDPLTALTIAHARLNQRSVTWSEDALMALYLCEIALGPCETIKPPPKEIWEFEDWLYTNLLCLVSILPES